MTTTNKAALGTLVEMLKQKQKQNDAPSSASLGDNFVSGFIDAMVERGLELYPAQEEAVLELASGHHVIMNTPTGSGKSLVASALATLALARGQRVFYTCPIKALVSEKFFAACADFGQERVGMMTGDASINPSAPFICCTAEVLASIAYAEGDKLAACAVIHDEFHYYSDKDRGMAWQVPLLLLPKAQFLLMSATLGDTEFFERTLKQRTSVDTVTIKGVTRPVPLEFSYVDTPLHETVGTLLAENKAPIYLVNFSQRAAAEQAQNLMSIDVCSKDDKKRIAEQLHGFRLDTPYGKELQRFVRHGLGLHHAGLLPKYRLLVERLAQQGLLRVISGTDTLGVGVNVPIRSVLFTQLFKFDGEKTAVLTVRDFHQIAGRAGRRGFDTIGYVVAQAPEHVIENKRLEAKAAAGKKIVKKKPPDRGYAHYDEQTYLKLQQSPPEPLRSRFQLDHSVVMAMLSDTISAQHGYRRLRQMIGYAHVDNYTKGKLRQQARTLLKDLVTSGVVVCSLAGGVHQALRLQEGLDRDFSLHHSVELYLLDQLAKIDRDAPDYALVVLTLVESTLEDPNAVLQRQVDRKKDIAMAEMKMEGVPYEERIERLQQITYDKPMEEALYATFNAYREHHPYLKSDTLRPKSIGRAMYEQFASFNDYVRDLGLERSEGVLLRYLSDMVRVLDNTVPEANKNEALNDAIAYFTTLLRATDRSLVDAWEKMFTVADPAPSHSAPPKPVAIDWTKRIRSALTMFARELSLHRYEEASELLLEGATSAQLQEACAAFEREHGAMRFDAEARANGRFNIGPAATGYTASVQFVGNEGPSEWLATFHIERADLERDDGPLLRFLRLGSD